jgi:hypothetical protein
MSVGLNKKPGLKGEPHQLSNIDDHYIQKFYDRIDYRDNGCQFLKGNVQSSGYINWWYRHDDIDGSKRIRFITAHRFAALVSGKFEESRVNDYCVLHDCDQYYENNDISYRQCVNPDHLWIGTTKENILDCIRKGRYVKPPTKRGEDNYNAKLTEIQAQFIVDNHYIITQKVLANIFNVSQHTIELIHRNKTWLHLQR